MAGWSKRVDGSGLVSFRKPDPIHFEVDYGNAKLLFLEILTIFYKEATGPLCYRSLPQMLGDGKPVDLFKLYLIVRGKGGYGKVSSSGSWGLVAKDCGFDSSYGLAVKLVYVKHLDALVKWMSRYRKTTSSVKSEVEKADLDSGNVELDMKEILKKINDEKSKDGEFSIGKSVNGYSHDPDGKRLSECTVKSNGKRILDSKEVLVNVHDEKSNGGEYSSGEARNGDFHDAHDGQLTECTDELNGKRNLDLKDVLVKVNDAKSKEAGYVNGKSGNRGFDDVDGEQLNECNEKFDGKIDLDCDALTVKEVEGYGIVNDDCITRKRKRESYLDMVKWISEVAKNPCDSAIGYLPERSKWKDYGSEVVWKQVLLLRDELLLKRDVDARAQCSIWQIKQKMHPSMYDDTFDSESIRCSQRVLSAKLKKVRPLQFTVSSTPSSRSDEDRVDGPTDSSSAESAVSFWWKQQRKRIPVGPEFQVDVPEWVEEIYESDSKWLGTRVWPKREQPRMLSEREDICSCQSPGSNDCVRLHVVRKRKKVKVELGSAYYHWKFDSMGDEVALSWSKKDEVKFQDIVKSSTLYEGKSFWIEIFNSFRNKSRESLVSYYFNVFLLRRRGDQNRANASNCDSDDDESEYGPRFKCFGRDTIFCSPKKSASGSKDCKEQLLIS